MVRVKEVGGQSQGEVVRVKGGDSHRVKWCEGGGGGGQSQGEVV